MCVYMHWQKTLPNTSTPLNNCATLPHSDPPRDPAAAPLTTSKGVSGTKLLTHSPLQFTPMQVPSATLRQSYAKVESLQKVHLEHVFVLGASSGSPIPMAQAQLVKSSVCSTSVVGQAKTKNVFSWGVSSMVQYRLDFSDWREV